MLRDLAAEAVSDPENWWRYDPDEDGEPDQDTKPMTTI